MRVGGLALGLPLHFDPSHPVSNHPTHSPFPPKTTNAPTPQCANPPMRHPPKVDDSRKTLAACVSTLQSDVDRERAAARAAGAHWEEPAIGIMVLAYKERPKLAELPADIMKDRWV